MKNLIFFVGEMNAYSILLFISFFFFLNVKIYYMICAGVCVWDCCIDKYFFNFLGLPLSSLLINTRCALLLFACRHERLAVEAMRGATSPIRVSLTRTETRTREKERSEIRAALRASQKECIESWYDFHCRLYLNEQTNKKTHTFWFDTT